MVTVELVQEHFEYRDGDLIRKINRQGRNANKGSVAGCIDPYGYRKIRFENHSYRVHRLVWFMHYGFFPISIDHIDGNRLNNKIENLREATSKQNNQNRKLSSRNTSGIKGVNWDNVCNKWVARIYNGTKNLNLGRFTDIKDAENAVMLKRIELHGEFTCHG
jgi:hypothetical protein